MELVGIENSRVILLTQIHRPSGQLYLPEATAKLVQRYFFVKYPTGEDLLKASHTFSIGKFGDVQIQEMSVYPDGLIVASSSDTDILDAFLEDLFAWTRSEFGLVPVITAKPERYYESSLVVKSRTDLALVIKPAKDALEAFNQIWCKEYFATEYAYSGFLFYCDAHQFTGRRKPMQVVVDRRSGFPFDENVFYCTAPLTTKDHLAFLERLEDLARPG